MTLFLFALGSVILSFGFVLGWVARVAVEDLNRYETIEDEHQADVLPFPERPGA